MDDLHAPVVAGYSTGRLLGRGGSASVWLAIEQRTGREVALKCFHDPESQEQGARTPDGTLGVDAIRREIRILSVLNHQHLVRAHAAVVPSAGAGAGVAALVMDYAPGGSLAALVAAHGRISVGETVTVLTPVAQALAYLHGQGFTHADVSPGNVLFTAHGKPLLSDVGMARMLGDPAATGPAGTPGFQDPAPVDAVRAGLQPERDVYSVAALGWFCLTGHSPARTLDRMPLSLLVPGVPPDLAAILEAGLSEDRRLRPTAAALASAAYRSAAAAPLDLASSVHPSVLPQLLTRRPAPEPSRRAAVVARLGNFRRRLATVGRTGTGGRITFPAMNQRPGGGQPARDFSAPQDGPPEHDRRLARATTEVSRPASRSLPAGRSGQPVQDLMAAKDLPAPLTLPAGRGRHAGRRQPSEARRGGAGPRFRQHQRVFGRPAGTVVATVAAAAACAVVAAVLGLGILAPLATGGGWWPGSTAPSTTPAPAVSPGGADVPADQGPAAPDSSAAPGAPGAPGDAGPARGNQGLAEARGLAAAVDPAQAIVGLAALRDQAFRTQQPELLAEVNAPGSAAAATDTATMDGLLAGGRLLAGFTSNLTDVAEEPGPELPEGEASAPLPPGGRAVVGATVATSAYTEVDAEGSVLVSAPAGGPQRLRLVLVQSAGSWRVSEILAGG